jgi:hypothetical protein
VDFVRRWSEKTDIGAGRVRPAAGCVKKEEAGLFAESRIANL